MRKKSPKPTNDTVQPVLDEPIRHVRLHLPDPVYRAVRHRLADAGPETSISVVITELISIGLKSA
ncbi:MAG: hypothetical protein IPG04_08305 [Polyangiaceae bacterium]|nr:hypothetical protein [Polyangiaceae bacterium]